MCVADAVQQEQVGTDGGSFREAVVFLGRKRRHHQHQRGKNKTVNIFECVVAIGAASDGLMWAGKCGKRWGCWLMGGWHCQLGASVGGPAGFLPSVF